MNGKYKLLVALLALAFTALACGGGAAPPTEEVLLPTPVPPTPVPPTDVPPTAAPEPTKEESAPVAGAVDLEFVNNTGDTICYIFVTESGSDGWGPDQLETEVVGNDDTFTVTNIPYGFYDVKTEDCDRNVISWNYDVELYDGGPDRLTVSGVANQLMVVNNSDWDMCGIWISPTTAESWGRPQVDDDNPIVSGTTRLIASPDGVWDLRADTCDGQTVERLGEDLTGGTDWTFTTE